MAKEKDLYFWINFYGGIRRCRVPADFKSGYWYGNVGVSCDLDKDGRPVPFSAKYRKENFFPTAEAAVKAIRRRLRADAARAQKVLDWLEMWERMRSGAGVPEERPPEVVVWLGGERKRLRSHVESQLRRAANLEKEVVPA